GGSADIAKSFESRKIEFAGERFEVDARKAGHSAQELLQPWEFGVEFFEHPFLAMLDFVLRFAGAQGFGQIVPEFEEPGIEHHQDASDITRAVAIEIKHASGRLEIARVWPKPIAFEQLHGHQSVEEI